MECCLCRNKIIGFSHNASPLADGLCCEVCNKTKVLPARLNGTKQFEVAEIEQKHTFDVTIAVGGAKVYKFMKAKNSLDVQQQVLVKYGIYAKVLGCIRVDNMDTYVRTYTL